MLLRGSVRNKCRRNTEAVASLSNRIPLPLLPPFLGPDNKKHGGFAGNSSLAQPQRLAYMNLVLEEEWSFCHGGLVCSSPADWALRRGRCGQPGLVGRWGESRNRWKLSMKLAQSASTQLGRVRGGKWCLTLGCSVPAPGPCQYWAVLGITVLFLWDTTSDYKLRSAFRTLPALRWTTE